MRLEQTKITIEGGLNYDFPRMVEVEQHFPRKRILDVEQTVRYEMEKIDGSSLAGKRIAITAGSREIAGIVDILREIGNLLTSWGAQPFIVPAMGSHGGATAAGQVQILEGLGITEESIGMSILSSMEAVEVARLEDGTPLYCDRFAFEADGIVICNKIKPHADFKGDYESGLVKMLTIGLAKHKGATALHVHGFDRFHEVLPRGAQRMLSELIIDKSLFASTSCKQASDTKIRLRSIVFFIRTILALCGVTRLQVRSAKAKASLSLFITRGILAGSRIVAVTALVYMALKSILLTQGIVVISAIPIPTPLPWDTSVTSRTTIF